MKKLNFLKICLFFLLVFTPFTLAWTPPSDGIFWNYFAIYNVTNITTSGLSGINDENLTIYSDVSSEYNVNFINITANGYFVGDGSKLTNTPAGSFNAGYGISIVSNEINVSADTCGAGEVSKWNSTGFECVVAGGTGGGNTTAEIQASIWDTVTNNKWCNYSVSKDRLDCTVDPVVDTNTFNTTAQIRVASNYSGWNEDRARVIDVNTFNTTAQIQSSVWNTITDTKWCKYTSATDRLDCNVEPVVDTNTFNTSAQMIAATTSSYVLRSDWTTHNNYPSSCPGGQYVSGLGDTLTCSTPPSASGGNTTDDMRQATGWNNTVGTVLTYNKTDQVLIGTETDAALPFAKFILSSDDFGNSDLANLIYNNAGYAETTLGRARGTEAVPLIVQAGDKLGQVSFNGYDGTDFVSSAGVIYGEVVGTPAENDIDGNIVIDPNAGIISVADSVIPRADNTLTLGNLSREFSSVYANAFYDGGVLLTPNTFNTTAEIVESLVGQDIVANSANLSGIINNGSGIYKIGGGSIIFS